MFSHIGTRPAGTGAGLSALAVSEGQNRLYSTTFGRDETAIWGLIPTVSQTGAVIAPVTGGLDAVRQIVPVTIAGRDAILTPGRSSGEVTGLWLDADGGLGARFTLGGARSEGPLADIAPVMMGQTLFLVGAQRDGVGLRFWQVGADQRLIERDAGLDADSFPAGSVAALGAVTLGGQAHVLAVSAISDSLSLMRVTETGLSLSARIDTREGLFLDTPTEAQIVTVAGRTYALVAGGGSGSLAVVELTASGGMRVRDLVNDDLGTRFAGVTALATAQMGGQVYVAVGGRDDGVSLMTLLPGGRLLHLATLVDDLTLALEGPQAIAMIASASGIDLFVAGRLESADPDTDGGLSHVRVELGPVGVVRQLGANGGDDTGTAARDQITGGAGNDVIRGGAGDDTITDGAGADVLWGGAGADVFVFAADDRPDQVRDYEPGIDRLDLSALGRFYRVGDLRIASIAGGAEIRLGEDRIEVFSASGARLGPEDFEIGDLRDLWRVPVAPLAGTSGRMEGEARDDLIEGRGGADTILGGGGADVLIGQGGDDQLFGGAQDAEFDPLSAQVTRLYLATLDRRPDDRGLVGWASLLEDGAMGLFQVARGFVDSREFQTIYGATDTEAFVRLLYRNVLDRAPDAAGLAGWIDLLDSGARSREQVVVGFSESVEFKTRTEAESLAYGRTVLEMRFADEVFRLYQATLDRVPDVVGFAHWTARLTGGMALGDVVTGFVASREFQATYGALGDRGFVTLLYQNVLDRAPEAAGLTDWVGRLAAGWTREAVVLGFSESREFTALMAPALVTWMRTSGIDDQLDGGAGDNLLIGGAGADVFVFRAETRANHVVVDLEPWDWLRFDGFGYRSENEVMARIASVGADAVFSDQDVTIRFLDWGQSDLGEELFLI